MLNTSVKAKNVVCEQSWNREFKMHNSRSIPYINQIDSHSWVPCKLLSILQFKLHPLFVECVNYYAPNMI